MSYTVNVQDSHETYHYSFTSINEAEDFMRRVTLPCWMESAGSSGFNGTLWLKIGSVAFK